MKPNRIEECGCCEVGIPPTPEQIKNRPGLPEIAYRVGSYASFRRAMIEAIAKYPELKDWKIRESDDYGVALLEMWAYLADILTFYQERIANETYLRTASHRDTIMRLAAMLDYKLNPGVAAATYLTFNAENNKQVDIPIGLRVQSVPGQDETPQKFETIQELAADAKLNRQRIFPQPKPYYALAAGNTEGTLTYYPESLAPGDKLVLFGFLGLLYYSLEPLAFQPGYESTLQQILSALQHDASMRLLIIGHTDNTHSATYNLTLSLRRAQAVRNWLIAQGIAAHRLETRGYGESRPIADNNTAQGRALNCRVEVIEIGGQASVEEKQVETLEERDGRTCVVWSPPVISDSLLCWRFVRKFRLFGYNAPESYLKPSVSNGSSISWTELHAGDSEYEIDLPGGSTLNLDGIYDNLEAGAVLLILAPDFDVPEIRKITAIDQVSDTVGPLSNTVTRVTLNSNLPAVDDRRKVVIYELSGFVITFWNRKYEDTLSGSSFYLPTDSYKNLEVDRTLVLDDTLELPQTVQITEFPEEIGDHLKVAFTPELSRPLETDSAVLFGNVAEATHGEKVTEEILGSGDVSKEFQEFTLKKAPTTFIPSATAPRGAENTLEIRVGGVLWQEVESLYGYGAKEQVYTTRVDDDGKMSIRFGDGKTGARLPTGQDNIAATYRQGLGGEGNVKAKSLTTLLDRPVGLKSVTNHEEAEGGTDPESLEEARTNAPNAVRTFERAISLRDFEDLARSYTGIAKAKAVTKFSNENEIVQLTIAGENGKRIEKTSQTYNNFIAYLNLHRDINHLVDVIPHSNRSLVLKAIVNIDPAYLEEQVISDSKTAVLNYFDFDNLQLGQGIHLSDIYAVLQAIDGITAVLIEQLDYKNTSPDLKAHVLVGPDQIAVLVEDDLTINLDLS